MRYIYRFLVLALCVLACLQAQDITKGSITGIVRDASGAVVPGATVKLESPFGDRQTTTNSGGAYLSAIWIAAAKSAYFFQIQ
jgi:hypothetical protein